MNIITVCLSTIQKNWKQANVQCLLTLTNKLWYVSPLKVTSLPAMGNKTTEEMQTYTYDTFY